MATTEHLNAHSKHRVDIGSSKTLTVPNPSSAMTSHNHDAGSVSGTATTAILTPGSTSTLSAAADTKLRARDGPVPKTQHTHQPGADRKTTATQDRGRAAIAYCRSCGSRLGEFYNSWLRITGSYHLPAQAAAYRSTGVQAKGKVKPALDGTALGGCTIQALGCSQCDDTVGIICTKAPENKTSYSEREFFKLPKIQLRGELSGRSVDAIIEGEQQQHHHQAPQVHPVRSATMATMTRPGDGTLTAVQEPMLPSMAIQAQSIPDDRHHDPPSARTIPSSQSPSLAQSKTQTQTQTQLQSQAQLEGQSQIQPQQRQPLPQQQAQLPPKASTSYGNASQPVQMRQADRSNGQENSATAHAQSSRPSAPIHYPSSLAVRLDAIDRIQTQVNLNRATLENCTRDIARLENSVNGMANRVEQVVESFRVELLNTRQHAVTAAASAVAPQNDSLDDHALEVFSNTLAQVVTKTNDIDALKMQFELIKRKIKRLEEGSTSLPVVVAGAYPTHAREASLHQPSIPAQAPGAPTAHAHVPMRAERPAVITLPSQHSHYAPEPPRPLPRPVQHATASGGSWVSVNTGSKRGPPLNGFEERTDIAGTPIASPKRPKLTPIEPRFNYEGQAGVGPIQFERKDTDESVQSRGYRTDSHESYPDATNASNFIPYATQDGPSDESWRPVSQRAVSGPVAATVSPRIRGRGRGGRPRKSMPVQPHITTTPDWERDSWTGSQIETDGFYRGAGVIRRGSGGALSGSPPLTSMMDPYAHTKKSRTRPIRNSDGVLIRKDGRPDMRSQSSAANLRRVHSKKEEERREGSYGAPTSGLAHEAMIMDSPDSTDSQDYEPSGTQERAQHIMKQMFPNGVQEGMNRLYNAQRHFDAGRSAREVKPMQHDSSKSESPVIAGSAVAETSEEPVAKEPPKEQDESMPDVAPTPTNHDSSAGASSTEPYTVVPESQSVVSSHTLQPESGTTAVPIVAGAATS